MKLNPLFIYIALYNCFNSFTTLLLQYENLYSKVVCTLTLSLCEDH